MSVALPQELGQRIREAREEAGFTAEQMAPLVGVTMGTLLRHERGETKRISYERLARIGEVTGKPLSWFMGQAA